MLRNIVLVILFGLAATCGSLRAVDLESIVIDQGDIDRLIIKLPAKHEPGQFYTVPYADSILDWMILPRDPDSLYKVRPRTRSDKDTDYYWLWTSDDEPLMSLRRFLGMSAYDLDCMVIFRAAEYRAYSFSLFSFWKRTPHGLKLVKLIPNPEHKRDLACLPMLIAALPDNSILIGSKMSWAAEEDSGEYYHFFRMDSNYNLVDIYSIGSQYDYSGIRYIVDCDEVWDGSYQITVTSTYLSKRTRRVDWDFVRVDSSILHTGDYLESSHIDSAQVEIIDLWQEAIKKFDIDTTQIE